MASWALDRTLILRGAERCAPSRFFLWTLPWIAMLLAGVYAAGLCLWYGLNQTNMDNRFAFGLWIFLDLTVIAFGAGAFFSGLLLYILKRRELTGIINSAVVVGLICYSGAVAVLAVDVGQPLRAWFTFWHPNVHSMLAEVTFCITCYLTILAIEYLPVALRNRQLRQIPSFLAFEFNLHKLMPVFAATGAFLSFFHQGSLGGLYGVLRGRPFAFRDGLAIWPTTFFLFILSAVACGPSFLILVTATVEKLTGKKLVRPNVPDFLGRLSGILLVLYVLLKTIDTIVWINSTSPSVGFPAHAFYTSGPFGTWLLVAEIAGCGLVPALLLLSPKLRARRAVLLTAAALACAGIALNRFVLTIQTLAAPTLPFDQWLTYSPSWQEVATFGGVIAYGVLLFSVSFRYLPLYPDEKELNA